MSPTLLYIARAGLYLSLFYAFYLLVMRRTTFFRLNRVLLLLGSYLCLLLPLIRLRTTNVAILSEAPTLVGVEGEAAAAQSPFPWQTVLLGIYLAGMAGTLVLYIVSAWKMGRWIRKGKAEEREGCRLVLLDEDIPSFSWGRKVVMSRKDLAENPAIFTHERMHVKCRHSVDMILVLPLQLLLWWNPLVWITREELRLLHEYEADEGVIQNGIDATQYQLLLVRKAVGEHRFTLASGFQHAQLKNRIAMMLTTSSSRWMRFAYLALLPVLVVFMYACNPTKNNKVPAPAGEEAQTPAPTALPTLGIEPVDGNAAQVTLPETEETLKGKKEIPFQLVEVKPGFNGGDANEFSKWVNSHLSYPDEAKKNEIQGRVTLQFTVGADGVVSNVKVLRSAHELLDAEALRVVSASPKWEPGKQDGQPVAVTYTFPVIFQLR
jgi:TonB family protein